MNAPNALTGRIDGLLKLEGITRGEAASEVTFRRRIGQPLGTEYIEKVLVLTSQLQVPKPQPTLQIVIGDAEDLVALVIGQMDHEKMNALVDIPEEANVLGHQVNGTDAPEATTPTRSVVSYPILLPFKGGADWPEVLLDSKRRAMRRSRLRSIF